MDSLSHIMKTPPMSLEDRLELAAQACRAAHLLSCEATCREAIAALSLESVRSEALKLAEEMDTYFLAARQGDADETLALEQISHYAARLRALQSPARVAEEKDVHSTELRK